MENTEQAVETATPAKTVIRPNLKNYIRAKSGSGKRSHRIDDLTARTLAGKSLDEIKSGSNLLGIDSTKWSHLNAGQQRMLIGNAIRKLLQDEKNPLSEQALKDVFGAPAEPYDAEKAAAEAAAAAEKKAAAKAEKEAKAAAKAAEAAAKAAEAATGDAESQDAGSEPERTASGRRKAK